MRTWPQEGNVAQLRTIIEEEGVSSTIDSAVKKYPRIGEIFQSLTWRMAREPEAGHRMLRHTPPVSLMKVDPDRKLTLPGITALYKFDNDEVNILAVRVIPPPATLIRRKTPK